MRNWLRRWLGIEALEQRISAMPASAQHDAAMIAAWTLEMQRHPPGSPRHTAFANRLRSLGVNVDGDRH